MKKRYYVLIFLITAFLDGCASKTALIDEDKLEIKSNHTKNSIDEAKLEAIKNIKSQIALTQNVNYNKNTTTNNGNKDIDPFLYLYKGLRND